MTDNRIILTSRFRGLSWISHIATAIVFGSLKVPQQFLETHLPALPHHHEIAETLCYILAFLVLLPLILWRQNKALQRQDVEHVQCNWREITLTLGDSQDVPTTCQFITANATEAQEIAGRIASRK